ncbi:peptidase inhibitor family I36 protein [Kineosporia succinea]|uniref:Peptidase inhibitor family I36 n=1 Tax=Kineosporia succinea TaxID=84632 RepID=A0ABT9NYU4_9ACTN|nr:peptidase inhibitor family I36 protein [Kineosporia succinea]MDP9825005.1 hypothetical protein [Kineosporia succinea]
MSKTTARRFTVLAAGILAALGGIAATAPAEAAPSTKSSCTQNLLCIWSDRNFDGDFTTTSRKAPDWNDLPGAANCPDETFNDCATAVWNNTVYTYRLYENVGYKGKHIDICANWAGNLPPSWNDRASSSKMLRDGKSKTCL